MNVFLHNKPYRVLTVSSFLSMIGSVLFNIVFIIYAGALPYKALAVSLVAVANLVPSFFQIPNGYLADHTRRRFGMMTVLKFVQFALYLLLAVIIQSSQAFWAFVVLLVINIASDTIADYTSSLVLPYYKHFIAKDQLGDATGFEQGVGGIIKIVFQGVGAALIVALHHNFALFGIINAVSFLVAGLVLWAQRRAFLQADEKDSPVTVAAVPEAADKEGFFASIGHSLRTVYQNKPLFALVMLTLLVNMLFTALDGLVNVTLTSQKALWFGNFGNTVAIIGMSSAIAMTAGALFTRDGLQRLSLATLITGATAISVLFGLNMVTIQNPYVMVGTLAAAAYLVGKVNPKISALVIGESDGDRIAATMSVISTLSLIGMPVGQAVFLTIANAGSPVLAWQLFAGAALAVSGFGLYIAAYLKRLAATVPEPVK
ncbi:MFS transporter [Schleiferilactobacillus shenzhenensis]|uniref:Major facilitator superfamily (MFS) profile domain-containing protein n=1 Tax=Schleiferilactobacillus shenzhenensis LY-73 TaxID=1231336 RepID=U4TLF3_9LACO|nr:MFS transporter [Schleiferilactobacillus shenzhenensis]ERL65029.1 hypothetical protein L248_2967 [Schleiferilactobacillus shenzhenensis LY-73]